MRDPVFMLWLGQHHNPNVPECVNCHLNIWRCLICSCSSSEFSCLFVTVTHLLEANVCDIPQDTFQCVGPFSLTQRILLSANDINIMWNMICGVILCFPQTLTLKPRVNVVGRTSITCGFGDLFLDNQLHIIQMKSITKCEIVITHIPGANEHSDHVWFRLF